MPTMMLELPARKTREAFNLRRWNELLADQDLLRFEGRVETDRHGHIIMSPPPAPSHGSLQSKIAQLLWNLLPHGRVLTECPISTADGVKAADVAWASSARIEELGDQAFFSRSPEICVEVLSPSNTELEMREKMALYFDAGAREVWFCARNGAMKFHGQGSNRAMRQSTLCPRFPKLVRLR